MSTTSHAGLRALRAPTIALLVAVVAIVVGIRTILRLPGLPYNVAELFLDRGSVSAVAIFALAVLWVGVGSMALAYWLAGSRRPYLVLPVGTAIASMVSRTLLKYSVTYESLDDILGANKLFVQVTVDNIWGAMGRRVFLATNAPYFVEYMERRLRYMALYSPLVVCLAVAMIPIARSDRARSAKSGVWYASLLASAIAWLWLGKIVTIDWAGTDNLTELIASAGPFGLGGGPFLYALVILMAASVALLVTATDWWTRCLAVFFAVAGIPLGWLLQRAGLERHIEKYGTVFSGTQFLLGPDRQHTLTESALFLRWVLVYGGAVTVMFVGVWLGRAFGTAIASGFRTASR